MYDVLDIVKSWSSIRGESSFDELCHWVEHLNKKTKVKISKNKLSDSDTWFYDEKVGKIHNKDNSFFQITGIQKKIGDEIIEEQPILIQNEIGYLGIICKKIGGILQFLMQAKIEPGNINKVQISPTIQATKSNFTQQHGGRKPAYLDFFVNANDCYILVDQIQSEQSSRFLGKRNRNIIICVPESYEIEVLNGYKWMSLGQIKALMKKQNLVNMDTRTVLSCIPFSKFDPSDSELAEIEGFFNDKALFNSIFKASKENMLPKIYQFINNYKMFNNTCHNIVPLHSLTSWTMLDTSIISKKETPFSVTYCDISIEGREVKRWTQPLFEAKGMACFGLFTAVKDDVRLFLVKGLSEIGCFDNMELAPTVQLEANYTLRDLNIVDHLFFEKYKCNEGILYDTILSEEGGRFYHEQNHNRIIEIKVDELKNLPTGYFWLDFRTLNELNQINNCLNIQLRNILSLLEV